CFFAMASSAGSIALALEGRAAMVTASAVRTYGLTTVPRRPSGANASGAKPSALIRNQHWKRGKEGSCPRSHGWAHHCRAFDRGRAYDLIARTRWPAPGGTRRALKEGVCSGESATLLSLRSVSSSRRPRTRHGSGG